mmetsp:Transcript_6851/g.18330  ORF Transcript_6851/g.18330 Transcript_6851/m.18330 type:complete len:678 (+) Transcript_6851:56-2089(+)
MARSCAGRGGCARGGGGDGGGDDDDDDVGALLKKSLTWGKLNKKELEAERSSDTLGSDNVGGAETGSPTSPRVPRGAPAWARLSKNKLHTCGYWTLFSWFVLMIITSLVFIAFTTVALVNEVKNPIAQYDFEYIAQLALPVVTICPLDLAVPYYPSSSLLHPGRKLLELFYLRTANGEVCKRGTPVSYAANGEPVFSDTCEAFVESFWMQADLFGNNVEADCVAELATMNVTKMQDPSFLLTPCKRCFRIGFKETTFVNETYIAATNTVQMQSAQEYFQCMYDPGGLHYDLLGTGSMEFSVNWFLKTEHRESLRSAGVLEYSDAELPANANADFTPEQACNVLFFSGQFVPSSDPDAIKYRFDASSGAWVESGAGPYFRVRSSITVMASGGFEMYLEPSDTELARTNNTNAVSYEERHETSIRAIRSRMRERATAAGALSGARKRFGAGQTGTDRQFPKLSEMAIESGSSLDSVGLDRHAISPSQRPVRAPLILVGGYDLVFIHFVEQIVENAVSYVWGSSSSYTFTPLNSPHTNNIEYGFGSLVVEKFYRRVVVDYWGYAESLFGWLGVFTGLSVYTILRNPIKDASKRWNSSGGSVHGRSHRSLPNSSSFRQRISSLGWSRSPSLPRISLGLQRLFGRKKRPEQGEQNAQSASPMDDDFADMSCRVYDSESPPTA